MNNCYGKNGDMQMLLVKIYPDFGDVFFIKCCVSDTDDTEWQIDEVDTWIDENMYNVSSFAIVFGNQDISRQLHLMFKADIDGNEFEAYTPEGFEETEDSNLLDWVTDYFGTVDYDVM